MATMKDIKDKVAKIATSIKNKFGVGNMVGMDAMARTIDNIPTHSGGTYTSNNTVYTSGKYMTGNIYIDVPQTVNEETKSEQYGLYDEAEIVDGFWHFTKYLELKGARPQIKSQRIIPSTAKGTLSGNIYTITYGGEVPSFAYATAYDALQQETVNYDMTYYYLT